MTIINPPLMEQAALSTLLSQPHRHYHNVTHVNELLVEMEAYMAAIGDPMFDKCAAHTTREVLSYAIWYHDAVYNPYAPSGWNEHHSANLFFQQHVNNQAMRSGVFDEVYQAIIATSRHTVFQPLISLNIQLMLDIDLSGFGKPHNLFSANGRNIRKEYYQTSEGDFMRGRLAFFRSLKKRETLYYTDFFRTLYHKQSQDNIDCEIEVLEHELE